MPDDAAPGGSGVAVAWTTTDLQTTDTVLSSLLGRYPHAVVSAINEESVRVPMPASISLDGHREVEARSTLDVVVPADRSVIVDLYLRARTTGMASGPVRLLEEPDRPVTVYLLNLLDSHGVVMTVFGDSVDESTETIERWTQIELPVRVARATKDSAGTFLSIDDALVQILGWPREELVGERSLQIVHPDDHELAIANWIDMLATPGPGRRVRLRHQHRDGHWVWLEITNHNRLDSEDGPAVVADMVDISEEMAAHEAVQARERLLHELAQTVPIGLLHSDLDGNLLFTNERLHEILETSAISHMSQLVSAVVDEDRDDLDAAIAAVVTGEHEIDLEFRLPGSDRGARICILRLRPLTEDSSRSSGFVGCLEDVTDSVQMRRKLEIQASYDPLTQCHNRASAMTAMQSFLDQMGGYGPLGVAVVYVDLDRFKTVNDKCGHATGDRVLTITAERIQQAVRASDIVGRMGGDEFIVVCNKVGYPVDALRVAKSIAARLCTDEIVGGDGPGLLIRASFGVAWTDDADLDPESLVSSADAAMYESKRQGQCEPVLANPLMAVHPSPG